jgi:alkanesulfonate monooxygenase SsuD/methylene tetrahydromethanopterin reductase-like flavin-dependent oxidoreductase (luciferase family)
MDELLLVGHRAARLLDADDASLLRVIDGALELLTEADEKHGRRWQLADYPATRGLFEARRAGQVVVGDPQSDRDEVAELERIGHGALLMVPLWPGDGRQALMEVYRRHAQAFTSGEIDRARVVGLQFASVLGRLWT